MACSILAILFAFLMPDRSRLRTDVVLAFPTAEQEPAFIREAQ